MYFKTLLMFKYFKTNLFRVDVYILLNYYCLLTESPGKHGKNRFLYFIKNYAFNKQQTNFHIFVLIEEILSKKSVKRLDDPKCDFDHDRARNKKIISF